MADTVTVAIRIRPLNKEEQKLGDKHCTIVEPPDRIALSSQSKTYAFDYIAEEHVPQEEIFNRIGKPIAESCLAGFNASIFAYGQTGAGKTYTIQGCGAEAHRGLLPRCLEFLFGTLEQQAFVLKCSYLEIYQEQIMDLLTENSAYLPLREDAKKGVYVDGLLEIKVNNLNEAFDLLKVGAQNRHIAATHMNNESSRSHAVFSLILEYNRTKSRFNLIDLAGSERQKLTGTTGERLKEASKINKSLSALGNVINTLSTGKKRHIHYRDSKLTFLLKESLGGNCKTCIVANISQAYSALGETSSTLQFAARAKTIKCRAIINENINQVQRLKEELRQTKLALEDALKSCPVCRDMPGHLERQEGHIDELQKTLERFRNDYDSLEAVRDKWTELVHSVNYLIELADLLKEEVDSMGAPLNQMELNHSDNEDIMDMMDRLNSFVCKQAERLKKSPDGDLVFEDGEENLALREENEAIFKQLEAYSVENVALIEENDYLQQENLALRQEISELNSKVTGLKESITKTTEDFLGQLKEKDNLIQEKLQTESSFEKKSKLTVEEIGNIDYYSEINQETEYDCKALRKLKIESEMLWSQLKESQSLNLKAKETIEQFQKELINKSMAIEKLQTNIYKAQKEIGMWKKCLENKNEQIFELKQKGNSLNDVCSQLNSQINLLRNRPYDDRSVSVLYEEIKIKNEQLEILQNKNEERGRKINALERERSCFEEKLTKINQVVSHVCAKTLGSYSGNPHHAIKSLGKKLLDQENRLKQIGIA